MFICIRHAAEHDSKHAFKTYLLIEQFTYRLRLNVSDIIFVLVHHEIHDLVFWEFVDYVFDQPPEPVSNLVVEREHTIAATGG